MIKIVNSGVNKYKYEPKFPLFYTDSEGKGLWLAIEMINEDKIMILNLVDRLGNEIKGNSVAYNIKTEFVNRYKNREFLEKDVIIQY